MSLIRVASAGVTRTHDPEARPSRWTVKIRYLSSSAFASATLSSCEVRPRSLNDVLDSGQFRARIRTSTEQLNVLATEMLSRACTEHPGLDSSALRVLAGDEPAHAAEPMLLAMAA